MPAITFLKPAIKIRRIKKRCPLNFCFARNIRADYRAADTEWKNVAR